jgi:adenylyltransferase/sulfurtransferase
MMKKYRARNSDLLLFSSDNLHTRYLINDACILGGKPLVSGSALGLEGQVTVYNYDGGPCFRCIHPEPSGSEMHRSCADNGVMGFVPGLIGSLQAAEVLKIIGRFGTPLSRKMNLYSALEGGFYAVNLPSKRACCRVCGTDKSITSLAASKLWGESRHLRLGNSRTCISSAATLSSAIIPVISCADYAALRKKGREGVLLDVRQPAQFAIFRLEGAVNIPHPLLETKEGIEKVRGLLAHPEDPIYCFCRRGVDSRRAVELLLQGGLPGARDVEGGALAWRRDVDSNFPAF